MDRISLTRTDRIDTIIRGALGGAIAGTLLAGLEMFAAVQSGDSLLWPWRMAASVPLGRSVFQAHAEVALFAGALVHLSMSVGCGVAAAILYEWSAWSRRHRASYVLACLAGAGFGVMVWFVNFPMIAQPFLPWMWQVNRGVQLVMHVVYGVTLGVALRALGRYAVNPPDSAAA